MAYFLFKFLHIVAAIIAIGSIFTLSLLNFRLVQDGNRAGLAAFTSQSEFLGKAVVRPSVILTLITGIVLSSFIGFGWPFWVIWGLAVILITGFLGGNVAAKIGARLTEAAAGDSDDSQLQALQRRLAVINTIILLLLFSAVWAMVFKPVL